LSRIIPRAADERRSPNRNRFGNVRTGDRERLGGHQSRGVSQITSTEEVAWLASQRSIFWGVALIVSGMLGGSLLLGAASVNLVVAWLIVLQAWCI